jgi:hypothetical protein
MRCPRRRVKSNWGIANNHYWPLVHLQCLEQKTNPTKVLSIREAQSRSRSRERLAAVELIIPLRHKAFTSDAPSDWIDRFSGSEVR